jgi:hypothetical protein
MRPRIKVMAERSTEDKILLLSKVYDVPYTIARSIITRQMEHWYKPSSFENV